MATRKQNIEFAQLHMPTDVLDGAIDYIQQNMTPDDVFSKSVLVEWAQDNGYKLQE